jgi:hypothetical protein
LHVWAIDVVVAWLAARLDRIANSALAVLRLSEGLGFFGH